MQTGFKSSVIIMMKFPQRKSKSKICCCVYGCTSKANRDSKIRFFHFPRKKSSFVKIVNKFGDEEVIDRLDAWIRALKTGKKITSSMRVCSLHFIEEEFIPTCK